MTPRPTPLPSPTPPPMGCPATGCVGYELTQGLDFAAASSYAAGAVESRWVQGDGWLPIGEPTRPFAAIFFR